MTILILQGQQKKKKAGGIYIKLAVVSTLKALPSDWVQILAPAFTHYMMGAIQIQLCQMCSNGFFTLSAFCGSCEAD